MRKIFERENRLTATMKRPFDKLCREVSIAWHALKNISIIFLSKKYG